MTALRVEGIFSLENQHWNFTKQVGYTEHWFYCFCRAYFYELSSTHRFPRAPHALPLCKVGYQEGLGDPTAPSGPALEEKGLCWKAAEKMKRRKMFLLPKRLSRAQGHQGDQEEHLHLSTHHRLNDTISNAAPKSSAQARGRHPAQLRPHAPEPSSPCTHSSPHRATPAAAAVLLRVITGGNQRAKPEAP